MDYSGYVFGSPNLFGWVALLSWFPVAALIFKRFEPSFATALTLLGGKLFLPERLLFKLPVFPDLSKVTIPVLAALLGCLWTARPRLRAVRPLRGVDRLFLLLLAGDLATTLTNGDALQAKTALPGLTLYDFISMAFDDLVVIYATFLLGRAMMRSARELRDFLWLCFVLALVYTPFCLFEFKMGPAANKLVYGFLQHSPDQALREGGWRPMVFLEHGLVLARFLMLASMSGVLLARIRAVRGAMLIALLWLIVVFINVKSMGALLMAAACAPLILFAGMRSMLRASVVLAAIVALYPMLRGFDLFPTEKLLDWAGAINADRAASLGVRFGNEDALLEKARQRMLFGWGAYARNHVYDEQGEDTSTTDGEWIIEFGERGLIGFLAYYGMYLWPVFAAARKGKRLQTHSAQVMLGGFALITVLLAVDTVPNASLDWPHMFWSGALFGASEGLLRQERLKRLRALWAKRATARSAQAALQDAADPA